MFGSPWARTVLRPSMTSITRRNGKSPLCCLAICVRSAGFGRMTVPAMPSPLPAAPWHDAHCASYSFLPAAIEPAESHTWQAVGELMEEEQRAEAEAVMQRFAEEVAKLSGKTPVIFIRQGTARDALLKLIEEEPTVSILILAAGTGRGGPGPLISALTGKFFPRLTIPLTIVPGTLTDDEIDALT